MNDPRTRNVDPFRPPESYGDPWSRHKMPILLACLLLIVLGVVGKALLL